MNWNHCLLKSFWAIFWYIFELNPGFSFECCHLMISCLSGSDVPLAAKASKWYNNVSAVSQWHHWWVRKKPCQCLHRWPISLYLELSRFNRHGPAKKFRMVGHEFEIHWRKLRMTPFAKVDSARWVASSRRTLCSERDRFIAMGPLVVWTLASKVYWKLSLWHDWL